MTSGWPAVPLGSVEVQVDRLKLPDGGSDGLSVEASSACALSEAPVESSPHRKSLCQPLLVSDEREGTPNWLVPEKDPATWGLPVLSMVMPAPQSLLLPPASCTQTGEPEEFILKTNTS